MNLKIEDLEKNEVNKKKRIPGKSHTDVLPSEERGASEIFPNSETDLDGISIESRNLIQQSMKDALVHMIQNKEGADASM